MVPPAGVETGSVGSFGVICDFATEVVALSNGLTAGFVLGFGAGGKLAATGGAAVGAL
jgi:hypothetical protein